MSERGDVIAVEREQLRQLYNTLARATEAYAAGDPNTCAQKAREAKELVTQIHQEDHRID